MSIHVVGVIGLVIIFIIGTLRPINLGALALVMTFLVGTICVGEGAKEMFSGFPVELLVLLAGVTYLFGIAESNGTVRRVVEGAARLVKDRRALIPWAVFVVAALPAMAGALGSAGVALLAPLAMRLAQAAAVPTTTIDFFSLRRSLMRRGLIITLLVGIFLGTTSIVYPQRRTQHRRPNIVLIFPDNLGWGEIGAYGSVRGVPTRNIDRLATEGIRLTNFNVEFSCTVSRAALLTGRYAVRTGAVQNSGITQWEITIAEALKSAGYATGLFGKWHVGGLNWQKGRQPTDQGFDEWYGIPMTSNEAQTTTMPNFNPATTEAPYIWEGKVGEPSRKVKVFDLESRRTVDREAAERGIAFMERSVKANKPFFLYYPITQIHFPTLAHPDFAGKTGAGDIGDSMADVDHNTGLVLDALKRLGVERNTIVIWCTDNGAEQRRPWRGSSGPWSGFYNTVMEGGIRTPCLIRWPGRIPAGRVSNEIVHQIDFFPTLAAAIGADIVPKDRAIDGVNQLPFLTGQQTKSNRETVIYITAGTQPRAIKWKDWKFHYVFQPEAGAPGVPPLMRLFNLRSDPKEESDIKDANPWAQSAMDKIVADFNATTERYPHVPQNALDPYVPPKR